MLCFGSFTLQGVLRRVSNNTGVSQKNAQFQEGFQFSRQEIGQEELLLHEYSYTSQTRSSRFSKCTIL